jgi:hypothetical protein
MRTLAELISNTEAAWEQVEAWRAASSRSIEILDCDRADGEATLVAAQVTTRSPMGAVALHCGGILVDGGWLRILGAGHERIGGGLREWNHSLGGTPLDPPLGDALIVAHDALGGFFALNGGRWPERPGSVRYLAPDGTGWQGFDLGYSGLLEWSMSPAVDRFYQTERWPGWEAEVAALGPDQALSVYPPLGFEKTPPGERSRRAVPARELWGFHHDVARQAADLPDGARVRFTVDD